MSNAGNIPNVTVTREDLEKDLSKFGAAFGKGQNSRPAAGLRCVEVASKINIGPDDAKDLYTKFQTAAAAARGLEYQAEASFKVQVSKLRQFLTLGAMPQIDGVDVMNRTVDIISEMAAMGSDSPLKGSAYDNMVNIARQQIKSEKVELTDDEIRGLLSAEPEEKTLLDKVLDIYKRTYKLHDELVKENTDASNVAIALEALKDQILSMDGELPAMTAAEKAKVKAFNVLKAQGFTITEAGNTVPVETISVDLSEGEMVGAESAAA